MDAVSIHGDDELDDIDKEIKGLSEGAAENSKKTPQKGTFRDCDFVLHAITGLNKLSNYPVCMSYIMIIMSDLIFISVL